MSTEAHDSRAAVKLPRIAITFCVQCKWMLRAAYFGQELLSTFGTSIGEIALIPATGGVFTVCLTYAPVRGNGSDATPQDVLLWDRKAEGGFPETKILKQRVRDRILPDKNLGHSDTPSSKVKPSSTEVEPKAEGTRAAHDQVTKVNGDKECEDCA